MVARWQRVLTLIGVLAVLAGVALLATQGHGAAALALLAAGLCAHAVWLGFTCLMAFWQNLQDASPRASAVQLLRAWWAEVRTSPLVFCWQQPFRSQAEPDLLAGAGRPGVVLVHGFVCNRGFWNPWMRRLRAQGVPFVAVSLEPVFGSIDAYVPTVEDAVRRLTAATGVPPLLVGHSMGGLAIRAWLRAQGEAGDARIRGVVTLGSPHQGTWLAQFSRHENGRQMRAGGPWLSALAAAEPASRRRAFLCVFSHCDNIVFPARTATLPGAAELHVPGAAHVDLVHHPVVWQAVMERLGHGVGRQALPIQLTRPVTGQ